MIKRNGFYVRATHTYVSWVHVNFKFKVWNDKTTTNIPACTWFSIHRIHISEVKYMLERFSIQYGGCIQNAKVLKLSLEIR